MKSLWAPWRMAYILGDEGSSEGCIFEAAGDHSFDKTNLVLMRTRQVVVLLNRFPYANGHLLVAPARHLAELAELSADENLALMATLGDCVAILTQHFSPAGFNIGLNLGETAGAGLADHLHFHIVPRWEGDHNFMTVLAEVRTIPQHLSATFDQLLPAFQQLGTRPAPKAPDQQ